MCPEKRKSFAIARLGCLAVSSAEMRVQVIIDRLVAPLKNEKGKKGTVFLNGVDVVGQSHKRTAMATTQTSLTRAA